MRPPITDYLRVARGYAKKPVTGLAIILSVPFVLLGVIGAKLLEVIDTLIDSAEADLSSVKAWYAWHQLPRLQMYLSIYYRILDEERSDPRAVQAAIDKMRAWSKKKGSPLAHWTDEMWDETAKEVWAEFDMQRKAKQHRETGV